uniref:Transposase n=1 Tax=Echinococcus granulosus TaxID=6210 RepID=A0A068WKD7_ECHGR|nr:hypothetical protein EgrG_000582000 [Echinococcus granulosus]
MRTELSEHLLLLPHAAPSPVRDSWRLGGELKFVKKARWSHNYRLYISPRQKQLLKKCHKHPHQ